MQDKIVIVMILMCIHVFSYAASDDETDEVAILQAIAKTPLEQELINTGRYALFKMVHKLYTMVDPQVYQSRKLIPEFKKNAELKLYLVFNDRYMTSVSDICMPWGRIHFYGQHTSEEKQKISFLVRTNLKVRHESFFEEFTCYQILKIEDEVIPNQMDRAHEKGRSTKDIREEWNLLSYMYKREQDIKWLHQHTRLYETKTKEFHETQG